LLTMNMLTMSNWYYCLLPQLCSPFHCVSLVAQGIL
jgi:hypothetical protein